MGFLRPVVVAVVAALSLAAPVHAESSVDAANTPAPPASAPVPAYEPLTTASNVLQPSLETAADIDAFLAPTPLAGMGAEFIRAEAATGVNARFLVGITWTENNSGASYLAQSQHNLFSFRGAGPGGWASYSSAEESIQTSAAFIGKEYARPGGAYYHGGSIAAVGSVYAADTAWAGKVARAGNFIGPSQGAPYAASIHIAALAPSQLTIHVSNDGFVPWELAPGAELLIHYRWARRAESVTGVALVPAPAIRSGGQADVVVPISPQPDGAGWRFEATAELTGQAWAEDLGGGAKDRLIIASPDSGAAADALTRDRPPPN
jgi:Mannosyl-glycoprotein endo-beta-N-acetylglucosaminidase